MRVYQLLPSLSYGDAVGNDTLALEKVIKEMGYETGIYADNIDVRLADDVANSLDKLPKLNKDDVIIYHLAIGSRINDMLKNFACKKLVIYHNITPPVFFENYSEDIVRGCKSGVEGAVKVGKYADYCLADSDFNRRDLINMGYKCDIDVLPILIPFEDYRKKPSQKVIDKYSDGYVNILFTGRIAPNKCHEDVIKAFYHYKKYYNPKSRLILVGSSNGTQKYYGRLKSFVNALGVNDVIFPGHIKFDEILAYYKVADVFLCQSEHEGFCVPLVEAMCFDVPIVAYDSSAIGETLGGSGILLKEKNPMETAAVIDRLIRDDELRDTVIANQRERLVDFDNQKVADKFKEYFKRFVS